MCIYKETQQAEDECDGFVDIDISEVLHLSLAQRKVNLKGKSG